MKAVYDRESSDIFLRIDTDKKYKDEYKIHMISENSISGVIPYNVQETKGGSIYRYNVSGMISMKNKFLDRRIEKEDMNFFVRALFDTVNDVKKYMLNVDELLLYPEFIFWDKDKWRFCYFPFKGRGFEEGFIRINDFFVKRIGNNDTEAIMFFHKIYKTSLTRPFTIDNIMRITEEQDQLLYNSNEKDIDNMYKLENSELKMVCENPDEKSIFGHYKRSRKNREKKALWGSLSEA